MELLGKVAEKHPDSYGSVVKDIKDLADKTSFYESASFNYKDIKPVDLSSINKKFQSQYTEIFKQPHSKERDDKLRHVNALKESDINAKVESDLATPNRFTNWVAIGARGAKSDARQIQYSMGNVTDLDNTIIPHMVDRSLSEGLTPAQFAITAAGARSGLVKSFTSVQKPGALAKELFNISSDHLITERDCGTQKGLIFPIEDKHVLTRCLLQNTGDYKRNDVITPYVRDMIKKRNIHSIGVRSSVHCKAKSGSCQMCVGADATGELYPIGHNIGIEFAAAGTEPLTQMVLDEKHTGGVVGKKSPFELAEQLYHVPENFTGGAVLSNVTGTVKSISKAPDGGQLIKVENHDHYVKPSHDIQVKIGDRVNAGHALTDGLINPVEVLRHTGDMEHSQLSLANQLHDVYDSAGVSGHKKVYEVLSRSVMNAAHISDPGDHHLDHTTGDLVRWSDVRDKLNLQTKSVPPMEAVNWRLAVDYPNLGLKKGQTVTENIAKRLQNSLVNMVNVYKDPMQVIPTMVGTARGALLKPDWMSHLAYARYAKSKLLEDLSRGAVSNIHGHDPLPAYIYGAEMTTGPDGSY